MNSGTIRFNYAYLLGADSKALTSEQVAAWKPTDGLLWVHLDHSDPVKANWVRENTHIEALAAEAILAAETRPRSLTIGDGLLVILRGVNLNPGADPEDMVSVRIWMTKNCIVTTSQRRLLSIESLCQRIDRGDGPMNAGEFLVQLGEFLADRIGDVVNDVEEITDNLEENLLTTEHHEMRSALSDVRRQSVALRRYLAPQRDALTRLVSERTPLIDDQVRMQLRELADRMTRYIEDLDGARERASVTHEELQNRIAELTNRRMYLLTMIAAIFLPLSFFTGLLGINVGGIPGAENGKAFLIVSGLLAIIAVAQWLFFRWRKWF